jgi:hypothetical protein
MSRVAIRSLTASYRSDRQAANHFIDVDGNRKLRFPERQFFRVREQKANNL